MKTTVILPTYNERGNLYPLVHAIRHFLPEAEILVVDDNSPDGTAQCVEEMARTDGRLHLLLRREARGRGLAGVAGFLAALKMQPDCVVEMDADLSHRPEYLPHLVGLLAHHDVAIGSRAVPGGCEIGRSSFRQFLTRMSTRLVRTLLRLPVQDCNSGYRGFRSEVLRSIGLDQIRVEGPEIVQDILFRAHRRGARIVEFPIVFCNRTRGQSSLTLRKLLMVLLHVYRISRLAREKDQPAKPVTDNA
ncbi:MAG: polyprenol monophosphomannose synthase [Planctomycetes bacterium]|nr:polyprenol monophosphomannose synthase [Planctomycetota bacterium]